MQRRAFRFSLLALAAISVALAATPVLAQWHLATTFENQSDGQANDSFGNAVAIEGQTLVVTAPSHQVGAAYVFTEDSNGFWSLVAELTPSDGVPLSRFGTSVAINGNTIVVGNAGCFECSGAAYVYVEPVAGWTNMTETAKLTGSDEASSDLFGISVAVSGNAIVVGAPSHQVGSRSPGAVYVYVRPTGGWTSMTETAELNVSDSNASGVGHAVALRGPTLVAGALTSTVNSVSQAGALYIFVRPLSGWAPESESATLTASDPTASAWLGGGVAISSDQKTIVAGAPFWHFASVPNGAAYIFVRPSSGIWQSETQTSKLLPPGGARLFGSAVALSSTGNVVTVGAPDTAITGFTAAGAAYAYIKPTTGWPPTPQPKARLNPPSPQTQGVFGASIAVRLTDVLVGEPGATVNGNASQGAAYLFSR